MEVENVFLETEIKEIVDTVVRMLSQRSEVTEVTKSG